MYFTRLLIATSLLASAPAWAVHKCVDANGKTVFQDRPCAGAGEVLEIRPASGNAPSSNAAAAATTPAQSMQESIAASQRKRRINDLGYEIQRARGAMDAARRRCDGEIAAIRAQQSNAANNLAGAAWLQSMATEMEAVASRCDTEQRMLQGDLQRLIDERTRLQRDKP